MHESDILEGVYKGCGGFVKSYPQNFPSKYLIACTLCWDYYNADKPYKIEGSGEIE